MPTLSYYSRRPITALVSIILCAVMLSSCGFQPLRANRGQHAVVPSALKELTVAPINDRYGQLLRQHIERNLTPVIPTQKTRFLLSIINLQTGSQSVIIAEDGTTAVEQVPVSCQMVLKDNGNVIYTDTITITSRFITGSEQYASMVAEDNAVQRSLKEIADLITLRTSSALSRHLGRRSNGN